MRSFYQCRFLSGNWEPFAHFVIHPEHATSRKHRLSPLRNHYRRFRSHYYTIYFLSQEHSGKSPLGTGPPLSSVRRGPSRSFVVRRGPFVRPDRMGRSRRTHGKQRWKGHVRTYRGQLPEIQWRCGPHPTTRAHTHTRTHAHAHTHIGITAPRATLRGGGSTRFVRN